MNTLTDIIFENINDEFAYGLYLGLKVIIMKENGYVNGSLLCKSANKKIKHWLENEKTKEYIAYYTKKGLAGIPATPLIDEKPNKRHQRHVHLQGADTCAMSMDIC